MYLCVYIYMHIYTFFHMEKDMAFAYVHEKEAPFAHIKTRRPKTDDLVCQFLRKRTRSFSLNCSFMSSISPACTHKDEKDQKSITSIVNS